MDRGNTTLDCLLSGPGVHVREHVDPTAAGVTRFLAGHRPSRCAASTVVPGGLAPVFAVLGDLVRVAGRDLPCPLRLAYPDPTTLGVDRWVAAVAARARHGNAVVVDCGTAVTVDLVTADGRHLGGAIGAGLGTTARALARSAPTLPGFDGARPSALPAITSADAVRAGIGTGFAHLVRGLVRDCVEAADLGSAARILTGGDAELAASFLGDGFVVESDLVHAGLRCLLDAHDSRC